MFTYNTRVSYSRTDRNGQVPLHDILNYMQDCSTFQSEALGAGIEYLSAQNKAWVIVSYKIRINKPIVMGQDICVGTTPTKFSGMYGFRNFFIKDINGEYLAQADSIWILIDIKSRKPLRITEEDTAAYDTEPGFEDINANRKLKLTGEGIKHHEFKVLKTYIDNNGHMNNADYLRAAEEFLPEGYSCKDIDIIYTKEAFEGDVITPYLYKEDNGTGICFKNESGVILTKIKLV